MINEPSNGKMFYGSPFSDSLDDRGADFASDGLFEEPDRRNRWSVSWSDLMMTMFILFVVMFLYQAGNRDLRFGQGPALNSVSDSGSGGLVESNVQQQASEIFNRTKHAIKDEYVDDTVKVDLVEDKAVRIALAGDVLFDVGSAELKLEARWRLNQIAEILHQNSFIINVVGHTDSVPNHSELYPTNWELSAARACTVARYLIEEAGLAEQRFFVSGHSWHNPVAPNTTAYNRRLNRRVEIILMKDMPYQQPARP